jgi:hypothetical protein
MKFVSDCGQDANFFCFLPPYLVLLRYDVIKSVTSTLVPTPKPSAIPTSQPVGVCGNSICELSEHSSSCPSDCEDLILRAADVGAKGECNFISISQDSLCNCYSH